MLLVAAFVDASFAVAMSFECIEESKGDNSLSIHLLGTQCPLELGMRFRMRLLTVAAISILEKNKIN